MRKKIGLPMVTLIARGYYNLAEREEEERKNFLELRKSQADTSEVETVFPAMCRRWNRYFDMILFDTGLVQENFPDGRYDAIGSLV
jgi:hypothetical protein